MAKRKVLVSLPEELLEEIDRRAVELGVDRSTYIMLRLSGRLDEVKA